MDTMRKGRHCTFVPQLLQNAAAGESCDPQFSQNRLAVAGCTAPGGTAGFEFAPGKATPPGDARRDSCCALPSPAMLAWSG